MHRFFVEISRVMAFLGGGVLVAVILLVCASIVGRSLGTFLNGDFMQSAMPGFSDALLATGIGPIDGDYEILEAGIAFVIFAFLPLCQIGNGHASVDFITRLLPPGVDRMLRAVTEVAFAAVLIVIAWQLGNGMAGKIRSGQTTFLLQFPVWWAYGLSLFGATLAAIVGLYVAGARIAEVLVGRTIIADIAGADH